MLKKEYVFLILFMTLFVSKIILKSQIGRKKRKYSELIVLNNKLSIVGLLFLVFFISWIVLMTKDVLEVYNILKDEYIDSFLKMFDLKYIDSLSKDFYNKKDVVRYLQTYNYANNFFGSLYRIVFSFSFSLIYFYRGAMRNIIYKEGIIVDDEFYKWDKLRGYYWCGPYEKSFKEGTYYKLLFKFPRFYYKDNELVLNIDEKDKEAVDKAIVDFVPLTEQQ